MATEVVWKDVESEATYNETFALELEAVRCYSSVCRSVNLAPVSIDPEPDWTRYAPGFTKPENW